MEKRRCTDRLSFKVNNKLIISLFGILLSFVIWFVRGWYENVNQKMEANAIAHINYDIHLQKVDDNIDFIKNAVIRIERRVSK